MKETGIMMSGDHPKLILDGLKTLTRRIYGLEKINKDPDNWVVEAYDGDMWVFRNKITGVRVFLKCPYGQVGDLLWVRETWATEHRLDNLTISELGHASEVPLFYKADSPIQTLLEIGKWRPSLFMPRWASRITREITGLRPERLQEITEEDARAEGIIWVTIETAPQSGIYRPCAVENFSRLWDSLNAKRGYGWSENKWVWVIELERR